MKTHPESRRKNLVSLTATVPAVAVLAVLAACTGIPEQHGTPRKETIYAVTAANHLIRFNAGEPGKLLSQQPLVGMRDKETLLGIDYRVAKGWLYGLGSSGRLYRINTSNGAVTMIGSVPVAMMPTGSEVGFDFNPAVDRIRVVSAKGENLRLHPDTGSVVDGDPNVPGLQADGKLVYAAGDIHAGRVPSIVAAGYTYNKQDEKITTNFAIDAAYGTLVTQGSREGRKPVVSPNTGQLYTVGALGMGTVEKVSFDIADVSGVAFVAASQPGALSSSWYEVNLDTGKAVRIGTIGASERVVGMAIEP
jgi:outer membrane protein assembly factor BamB